MVGSLRRVVVCLLLLASILAPAGAAAASTTPPAPEADTTVTRIEVAANGSATWTLNIRTRLETDQQAEEYRAFQDRFRENTSRYLDPFRESIRGVVGNAENATGRQMRAVDFSASTSIQQVPRRWGVVTYEFQWTNFAATQERRLIVGDVFQGGFFIAENDTLEVVAPDTYRVASVAPEPDEQGDGVVSWDGREDFTDGRPQIVFSPAENVEQPPSDGTVTPERDASGSTLMVLLGLLVIGMLTVAAFVWYRRAHGEPSRSGSPVEPARAATGGEQSSASGAGGMEELVTDEDQVRRLLTEQGGRMRQKGIGEELDWSKSKVSRVLSRMEDEGEIEKLRIGRENVIELSEE